MNELHMTSGTAMPVVSSGRAALDGHSDGAVSWPAIFAGAAAAAALSLILLVLGTGLGFAAMSPWSTEGASAESLGLATVVWISFTALVASGIGGYLAGRLRVKWSGVHTDEVYFRDTAHGFLSWAVATIVTASLLTSAVGSLVGMTAKAGIAAAAAAGTTAVGAGATAMGQNTSTGSAMSSSGMSGGLGYFSDSLFRPAAASAGSSAPSSNMDTQGSANAGGAESGRIFARSLQSGAMTPDDSRYLGQLVSQRTGLSQQDAEKRVSDTYLRAQTALQDAQAKAKAAADQARNATAYASLWLFVSLLLGAFVASLSATLGGRQRDL